MATDWKKEAEKRREAEMARGRAISARHAAENSPEVKRQDREEVIKRYLEGGKLVIEPTGNGNNVAYCNGIEVVAERRGPAWPSENFVAHCALAVAALAGFDGVPAYSRERQNQIDERNRRNEMRSHVIDWSKGDPFK